MALIKDVDKGVVRREWRVISLVFAQLVVLVLIVVQLLDMVGFSFDLRQKAIGFAPRLSIDNLVVLALAIIAFAILYLAVKKRQPALYKAQKEAPGIIKEAAKQKLKKTKEDPRVAALFLIDFLFVVVVIMAVRAYLDPEIEFIPWSAAGLGPPVTTIVNAAIAVVVLALFYWMYRYTASYRKG